MVRRLVLRTGFPPETCAERLRAIAGTLPETDGVACFTGLYVDVTDAVGARERAHFEDIRFGVAFEIKYARPSRLVHGPEDFKVVFGGHPSKYLT